MIRRAADDSTGSAVGQIPNLTVRITPVGQRPLNDAIGSIDVGDSGNGDCALNMRSSLAASHTFFEPDVAFSFSSLDLSSFKVIRALFFSFCSHSPPN